MTSWKANSERRRELIFRRATIAVDVSERNLGGRLAAVDGDIAHVGLEAKGSSVDAADFGAAAGDALHFGDEAAADERLERVSIDVYKQAKSSEGGGCGDEQQIFPPARGRRAWGRVRSLRLDSRVVRRGRDAGNMDLPLGA